MILHANLNGSALHVGIATIQVNDRDHGMQLLRTIARNESGADRYLNVEHDGVAGSFFPCRDGRTLFWISIKPEHVDLIEITLEEIREAAPDLAQELQAYMGAHGLDDGPSAGGA